MFTLKNSIHEAKSLLAQEFKAKGITREYAKERISEMEKTLESIEYICGMIEDQFKIGYHDNRIVENLKHTLEEHEFHESHAREYLKYLNERF